MTEQSEKTKEIKTELGKSSSSLPNIIANATMMNTVKLGSIYYVYIFDSFTDTLYKYVIKENILSKEYKNKLDGVIKQKEKYLEEKADDKTSN